MHKISNSTVLAVLLFALAFGVAGVVYLLKTATPNPGPVAPTQAQAQAPAPTAQEPAPITPEPTEADLLATPAKPLTYTELHSLAKKDLEALFPEHQARFLANLCTDMSSIPSAKASGLHFINLKYLQNNKKSRPLKQQDTEAFLRILDGITARLKQNQVQIQKQKEIDSAAWKKELPLYREKLSYLNSAGQKPLSVEESLCPSLERDFSRCQTALYPNKTSSNFFFEGDFLYMREDLDEKNRPTNRFRFFQPTPYDFHDTPEGKAAANGMADYVASWDGTNKLPQSEAFYGTDGLLEKLYIRLFEKNKMQEITVNRNGHLAIVKETPITPSAQDKERVYAEGIVLQKENKPLSPYSFPRAPLYNQLYRSPSAAPAQSAPELL